MTLTLGITGHRPPSLGGYAPTVTMCLVRLARAMQVRNMRIVRDSNMMPALWNGERRGGTWNCIEYARMAALDAPVSVTYRAVL